MENGIRRQRFTPEQIIAKLREVDVLVGRGSTAAEACRQIGIAEQTLYRWRKEYGGLKVDQARRMKDLERENAWLKKLVADLALDKAILQEASKLNFEPLPSPRGDRGGPSRVARIGAAYLPGAWPAPLDAAPPTEGQCRRAATDCRHHRAGDGLWSVWLSSNPCSARQCRLASQPVGGRADLAAGGFEGSQAAAETPPSLAGRRVVHAPSPPTSRACLVL
jgi:putative transposase